MKKNNLERFVRDNREAFDDKEPPNDLWQKLESRLAQQQPGLNGTTQTEPVESTLSQAGPDQSQPVNTPPFLSVHRNDTSNTSLNRFWRGFDWRVAASIAVLLLAGGFLYMNHQYGVSHQPEVVVASPGYAKEVVHYTRLIDDKRAELKHMTESNPALYQEFSTDLDRLEKSYQSLKADLPQNPNQEVLIQAMIQNLQLQINLLNEQLRVIQRIKQQTYENPV